MKPPKPEKVPIVVHCSICGENWDKHPDDPTIEDCVEILKNELQIAKNQQIIYKPYYPSTPYVPGNPWWYSTITTNTLK